MRRWYDMDAADALRELHSDCSEGLSDEQAVSQREKFGPNELVETGGRGPWRILWEQLSGAKIFWGGNDDSIRRVGSAQ